MKECTVDEAYNSARESTDCFHMSRTQLLHCLEGAGPGTSGNYWDLPGHCVQCFENKKKVTMAFKL